MSKEMEYHIKWEIDVTAGSPLEAAREALTIQRDPKSIATVFEVRPMAAEPDVDYIWIDLLQIEKE